MVGMLLDRQHIASIDKGFWIDQSTHVSTQHWIPILLLHYSQLLDYCPPSNAKQLTKANTWQVIWTVIPSSLYCVVSQCGSHLLFQHVVLNNFGYNLCTWAEIMLKLFSVVADGLLTPVKVNHVEAFLRVSNGSRELNKRGFHFEPLEESRV